MTWLFEKASAADIDELMTWFPDACSIEIWGGPKFRYPFSRRTFHKDCRWREFSSFCLRNDNGDFAAFGQFGSRFERIHLARLVAHPTMRGQGLGKKLITLLIEKAKFESDCLECGLFVYQDNIPAYHCYLSLGFEVQEYPQDAPMREQCFYLTKSI